MTEPYRDDVLSEQLGVPVVLDDRVPRGYVYFIPAEASDD